MKICHIIFALETGGAETMLVDIINEQVKTETVYLVIVNNIINLDIWRKVDSQVNIITIGRIPLSKNPFPLVKLNFYLFTKKPDIIHFHDVKGIELLLPCFRKKTILTIHDTKIEYPFFAKYKKLFAISKSVKEDIFMRYTLDSSLVYDGINTSDITTKTKQKRNSNFRIVQVSRLHHQKKGQDLLIKAVKQLVYNFGLTNIYLDFIGDGISMSLLEQLVIDCELKKHITFLGNKNRDYVYKHLCDYDLLVQPSRNEGFGLTVVEGMAAKIPVLISDIEGPMEIIENGNYGYHFKTEDINDLTKKIKYIIDNYDEENNVQMIEKSYKHVVANFDIKNTASNYLKEYKEILSIS
jgi:glycosyltransferase involved in cell wall biosynthesis